MGLYRCLWFYSMFQLNHILYYLFKLPVSDSARNLLIRLHGKHFDSLYHCEILWSEDKNSELCVPVSRSEPSFILNEEVVEEHKTILVPRDQKQPVHFKYLSKESWSWPVSQWAFTEALHLGWFGNNNWPIIVGGIETWLEPEILSSFWSNNYNCTETSLTILRTH